LLKDVRLKRLHSELGGPLADRVLSMVSTALTYARLPVKDVRAVLLGLGKRRQWYVAFRLGDDTPVDRIKEECRRVAAMLRGMGYGDLVTHPMAFTPLWRRGYMIGIRAHTK